MTTSENRNLYITQPGGAQIAVFSLYTNLSIGAIFTDPVPNGIAISQSKNLLYVAFNNTVGIIDLATNTLITQVPLGRTGGQQVAVDEVTGYAYITVTNPPSVIVIDNNFTIITAIDLAGAAPQGIAIDPNANFIYVASNSTGSNSKLFVINRANNSLYTALSLADNYPYQVAVNPIDATTTYIYVTQRNASIGKVTVAQRTNNAFAVINTIAVGGNPSGIVFNASLKELYVANAGNPGSISVIDTVANSVVMALLGGAPIPTDVIVDEATQFIYASSTNGTISMFRNWAPGQPVRDFRPTGILKTGTNSSARMAIKNA